jgi:hypothetical protein
LPRAPRRPAAWTRARLALLLFSCAFALGAGELAVRLLAPQWALVGLDFFAADPDLGWTLAPNHDGLMSNEVEYRVRVRTDERGLRVGARGAEAGPAILGLGDSYAFGFGVDADETFLARAAARAGARAANAGVPGYGPCQAAALGTRLLETVHPRATLLAIFLGNDERDAARGTGFLEVRDGALVPPGWRPSPLRPFVHPLFESSHLVRFVRFSTPIVALERRLTGRGDDYRAALSDVLLAAEPDPPAEIVAGDRAMASCLPELNGAASGRGAPLLAVLIPDWTEVDSARLAADEAVVGRARLDPSRPIRRISELLDRAGIRYVDLTPVFRTAVARGERLYYEVDRHLNPNGHRLASEALIEPLSGLLDGRAGAGGTLDERSARTPAQGAGAGLAPVSARKNCCSSGAWRRHPQASVSAPATAVATNRSQGRPPVANQASANGASGTR